MNRGDFTNFSKEDKGIQIAAFRGYYVNEIKPTEKGNNEQCIPIL